MRNVNWKFAAWAFAVIVAISGGVYASVGMRSGDNGVPPPTGFDGCFTSCGGEIPWPFQVSNQAVELSDGERYLLMGRVEIINDRPFFVVDLVKHPWLNTAKRRDNPRYVLEGAVEYWKAYAGKRIRLVSMAEWQTVQDVSNLHGYRVEVTLQSLADPAIIADTGVTQPEPVPPVQN
jgi:hypothetical protein